VTAPTETGDLTTVATAPPALQDSAVVPGVTATVPSPAPAGDAADAAAPVLVDVGPRPLARLRALRGQGLTAPGGIALAVLLLAPGVALDWVLGGSFGTASSVAFVLAAVTAATAVRTRALGTAAVLPPLLFVGAVGFLAWSSGNNRGRRELVLDVGTTLAVSAPVLFVGTAAALAVVLGRLVVHLVRR
jgi:hypothetical protein